jgi:hypothetical protein
MIDVNNTLKPKNGELSEQALRANYSYYEAMTNKAYADARTNLLKQSNILDKLKGNK